MFSSISCLSLEMYTSSSRSCCLLRWWEEVANAEAALLGRLPCSRELTGVSTSATLVSAEWVQWCTLGPTALYSDNKMVVHPPNSCFCYIKYALYLTLLDCWSKMNEILIRSKMLDVALGNLANVGQQELLLHPLLPLCQRRSNMTTCTCVRWNRVYLRFTKNRSSG